MVLDALSALGVAASVVQFIEFSSKLISRSTELYKGSRNALIETQELADVSERIIKLNNGLQDSLKNLSRSPDSSTRHKKLSPSEEALGQVSLECTRIAEEFMASLQKLLSPSDRRVWKSCRQAFETLWNKDGLETMQRRLNHQKEQLVLHLLVVISNKQNKQNEDVLKESERVLRRTKRMEEHILDAIRESNTEVLSEIQASQSSREKSYSSMILQKQWTTWQLSNREEFTLMFADFAQRMEDERRLRINEYILGTLHFSRIRARELQIHPAHAETFNWIFDTSDEHPKPFSSFIGWILAGDSPSIYWVAGKPGSGKSTLMHFLVHDNRTEAALRTWSSPKPLLTANCFFWLAGTELQKSFTGLIRSLLYDTLTQDPSLLPKVSPWRWKSCDLADTRALEDWGPVELEDTFYRLILTTIESHHLAFFIDGLDEFRGSFQDHSKLVDLLRDVSKYRHVKICVSSRPWPVFQNAFSSGPTLRVEDLTQDDIKTYVYDKFSACGEFQSLQLLHPQISSGLTAEIVDKARGVFLWVYLVVRSLLQGVIEGDSADELYGRLRQIPQDLDEFFRQIMEGIDNDHRAEASVLFRIVQNIPSPQVLSLIFVSDALADRSFCQTMESFPLSDAAVFSRINSFPRRIESRCKGLLEVENAVDLGATVDFLHRTVRDFLLVPMAQDILDQDFPPGFNIFLYMAQSMLARRKMLSAMTVSARKTMMRLPENRLAFIADKFFTYFQKFEMSARVTDIELVDHFLHLLSCTRGDDLPGPSTGSLVLLALSKGIELYALELIKTKSFDPNDRYLHPDADWNKPRELLCVCVSGDSIMFKAAAGLLEKGAKPDVAWGHFLSKIADNKLRMNQHGDDCQPSPPELAELARQFIEHGAGPYISVGAEAPPHTPVPGQLQDLYSHHGDVEYPCAPLIEYIFPGWEGQQLLGLFKREPPRDLSRDHSRFQRFRQAIRRKPSKP